MRASLLRLPVLAYVTAAIFQIQPQLIAPLATFLAWNAPHPPAVLVYSVRQALRLLLRHLVLVYATRASIPPLILETVQSAILHAPLV